MKPHAQHFAHRNLALLLLQAREAIFGRFRALLNAEGVTEQQWRVVRALLERGPLEPRQIEDVCCLSSPSLAGILARMDDLGLVLRERHENDQRRVRVSVTARGRELAAKLAPQIEGTYREIEKQAGADFIKDLYATLDELIARLGEPAALPDDSPRPAAPRAPAKKAKPLRAAR
ncbi:MAG: homoprotocatechuate degradation operon regulator HpaR [Burkholderiales bacterium]|nr:homoprotocatechuate degradation operon regulator HpaR [Burkholderiales bacterium]